MQMRLCSNSASTVSPVIRARCARPHRRSCLRRHFRALTTYRQEWNLPLASFGFALERVLSWNERTLLLGGGGYHNANAARAWTYLTSVAVSSPPLLALSLLLCRRFI